MSRAVVQPDGPPEVASEKWTPSGHPLAPQVDLHGRRFLVTGAASGIGLATAEGLVERGAEVLFGARSWDRGSPAVAWLRKRHPGASISPFAVDLSNLREVDRAAKDLVQKGEPLHGLINNAAIAGAKGLTADGFEITYATNHLGPFLLTERLLPLLEASAPSRIVMVTSHWHFDAKGIPWDHLDRPLSSPLAWMKRYRETKLMNVLYARELSRRLAGTGVSTYAAHPGMVASEIWRRVPWPLRNIALRFMLTPEDGAQTQLRCAIDPDLQEESGRYWKRNRPHPPSSLAQDDRLGDRLREKSLEHVRQVLGKDAI